jgi:hypothetical protein
LADSTRALGGQLGSQVLIDLLRAQRTGALHGAGALGVGVGLCGVGLGFCQLARASATSACTLSAAKVASNWPRFTLSPTFTCSSCTRRPLVFSTHTGLLPGGDAAVGGKFDRQTANAGLCQGDGQRWFASGGCLTGIRRQRALTPQAQADHGQRSQNRQRHRFEWNGSHGKLSCF